MYRTGRILCLFQWLVGGVGWAGGPTRSRWWLWTSRGPVRVGFTIVVGLVHGIVFWRVGLVSPVAVRYFGRVICPGLIVLVWSAVVLVWFGSTEFWSG